jgi:hypothetical protein
MTTINMIDCATKLDATSAATLVKLGIKVVGRYLSHSSWKGFTAAEAAIAKAAGLGIVSIFENAFPSPTNRAYFANAKGVSDANFAFKLAKEVGQPEQTAIYFTCDFDAQAADLPAILDYFKGVKATLKSYKVGVYGNYNAVKAVHDAGLADYFWQTYAWSAGLHNTFLHIMQYRNDTTLPGINFGVDYDNMEKSEVGAWGVTVEAVATVVKPAQTSPWKKENGVWHYYENGVIKKAAWVKYKNNWYYLQDNGDMKQGWLLYKNNWYYLNPAVDRGEMMTGWIHDNGKTYYCNPAPDRGEMLTGHQVIDGKAYGFKANGELAQ